MGLKSMVFKLSSSGRLVNKAMHEMRHHGPSHLEGQNVHLLHTMHTQIDRFALSSAL